MLEGLQEEIYLHPELSGASNKIIMNFLNEPGTAIIEEWITAPYIVLKSLNEIYTYYISDDTIGKLVTYLQQSENAVMAARMEKASHLDLSSSLVINILNQLLSDGICTQTEYDNIIQLGQIKKSRAEELFGRKITIEDFE